MLVKILGAVDVLVSIAFLMIAFGISLFIPFITFCAGILFLKGLFILGGEPLSIIDISSSLLLVLSLFFTPYVSLLWVFSLLMMFKGIVSFI